MNGPGPLHVLTGCDGPELRALRRELARAGAPLADDARDVTDARLGRRRVCPPPPSARPGKHVCPRCDPFGYARRALAVQRAVEARAAPGTILLSGRGDHLARVLLEVEAHKLPLLACDPARYGLVFLAEASARSRARLALARRENNLIRAAYELHGNEVVIVPSGPAPARAQFVLACVEERRIKERGHVRASDLRRATGLPPILPLRPGPPRAMLARIVRTLEREGLAPRTDLLLRVTEGLNLELVRFHGTDRAGRDRPMKWRERGYTGPARSFADVVYGTPGSAIRARRRRGPTALDKVKETPAPLVLAYELAAFDRVRGREYAFRSEDRRRALIAVFRVAHAPSRQRSPAGAFRGRPPRGFR